MTRLTKNQKEHLQNLKSNGQLFVGYNCPAIMRTFEALVQKDLATIVDESSHGKHFQAN